MSQRTELNSSKCLQIQLVCLVICSGAQWGPNTERSSQEMKISDMVYGGCKAAITPIHYLPTMLYRKFGFSLKFLVSLLCWWHCLNKILLYACTIHGSSVLHAIQVLVKLCYLV